jgi:hypothetical protein
MIVTIQIYVPDTMSDTIAIALEEVSDQISEHGYSEGCWEQSDGTRRYLRNSDKPFIAKFRIDQREAGKCS